MAAANSPDNERPELVASSFDAERDFPQAAELMWQQWYGGRDVDLLRALAVDELLHYLEQASFTEVVRRGDELLGLVVARHGAPDPKLAASLAPVRDRMDARFGDLAQTVPHTDSYYVEVDAHRDMLAECGMPEDDMVLLLLVSPASRGLGLGRRLLKLAGDHLRSVGAPTMHLVTDTDCDWQFYDHIGMERLAERGRPAGTGPLTPDAYYLYGRSLR